LFASLDVIFTIDYPLLDLFTAHKDGADHKLVVLQIVKLFQVVDTLSMPGVPSLFKFVPLFNRFQDCINLQNLVLEPHLDVDERVCQRVWKIVKISFKLRIFGVLEQELLFRQLLFLR